MKILRLSPLGMLLLGAAANAGDIDTSAWICEYCPFEDGHSADYEIGATSAGEDSAYFGNATGYDESGVYANVDGEGTYTRDEYRFAWRVEDLGLDSRRVDLGGGRVNRYDYRLSYSELPSRTFITTSTVFQESGGGANLTLPAGWVQAGTTSGFTALDGSLVSRPIESDWSTLAVGGTVKPGRRWALSADYRRREQDGVRIWGASSFTNASLLAAPIDYTTDEFELAARWGTNRSFVSLGWFLSEFENDNTALTWQQPFTSAAGAEAPSIAQAPGNQMQQLRFNAGHAFADRRTVLNVSAAMGQIEQNEAFLSYTNNANLAVDPLPRASLDGEIDTTNFAVSLSSRPFRKARLRVGYRYDERDNGTRVDEWNRVIVDTFVSGEALTNIPYSYERTKFDVSGHYDLYDTLRVGGEYERREIDRDFQEVASQTEDSGFFRARWRPDRNVEVDARIGTAERDIDAYNEALAVSFGQNPLLRKYNLAYRFRDFRELRAAWTPAGLPISVALRGRWTDDEYRQSPLGLQSGAEDSLTGDFTWIIGERASAYLSLGQDNIESEQLNAELGGAADWRATNDDRFDTIAAGLTVSDIAEKFDLRLNVMTSRGESDIVIDSAAGLPDAFPALETDLDRIDLELVYRRSERMNVRFDVRYQRFEASDWAIAGLAPDAAPLLLSLGAEPYDDDMLLVGVTVSYRLGQIPDYD